MKILSGIFILFFVLQSQGQTIRFNKTYDHFYNGISRNLIEYNNGYVFIGGGRDSISSPNGYKLTVTCIDSLGNLLWYKSFGDTLFNYYHGLHLSLKKLQNGNYLVAGSRSNGTTNAGLLYLLNADFDTIWTKTYYEDTIFTAFYDCIETYDNGYIMVGNTSQELPGNTLSGESDLIIVKTDLDGNQEWAKQFGGIYNENGNRIIKTFDHGYLIGGWTNSYGVGTEWGEWYIVKIDSLGNLKWFQHYGNPNYNDGYIMDIIPTKDSSYLFTGGIVVDFVGTNLYKSRLIKFKEGEGIVWDKLYGKASEGSAFGSIIELGDSSLMGICIEKEIESRSFLRKFTSSGDTLWKKPLLAPNCFTDHYLYTLLQTPDKGFIMSGVGLGTQKAWVVKTDSCGCDTTSDCECDLTRVIEIEESGIELSIYPNPAHSILHIKSNLTGNRNKISIIAMNGHELISRYFTTENEIDVSSLKSGLYILKIQGKDFVRCEKLMIE